MRLSLSSADASSLVPRHKPWGQQLAVRGQSDNSEVELVAFPLFAVPDCSLKMCSRECCGDIPALLVASRSCRKSATGGGEQG